MNIVVIGAGALGAYFGARWHEAGQNVSFLVRPGRAAQLRENGINIQSKLGDYKIENPVIAEDPHEIETADLVLLAVKGYNLSSVLDSLGILVQKGAVVLPVLNGVEHISILQKRLGEEAVIGGLSYIISTLDENGHVIHTSDFHDLVFGPLHSSQEETCKKIERISQDANMSTELTADIKKALWSKYMFINSFSGVTTAANLEIGEIVKYPETFQIAESILNEMQQLAVKQGVGLTEEDARRAADKLGSLNPNATSSMHQDFRKGRTLEVDHLHGGAIRLAQQIGMNLPVTETIHGLIKPFERA